MGKFTDNLNDRHTVSAETVLPYLQICFLSFLFLLVLEVTVTISLVLQIGYSLLSVCIRL